MPCGWDSVFGFLIGFFLVFGLYCLPLSVPGPQLENYNMRQIFPWMHSPHLPVVVKGLGGTKHDLTAGSSYV